MTPSINSVICVFRPKSSSLTDMRLYKSNYMYAYIKMCESHALLRNMQDILRQLVKRK